MTERPQLPISDLLYLLTHDNAQAVGALGEILAARTLERRGYAVSFSARHQQMGDLRVITPTGEIKRVEVKTSRQGKDHYWQFCLRKERKTDINHSDLVLLLCVYISGLVIPFVVPTRIFKQRGSKFSIGYDARTYNGKLAIYRQCLSCLSLEIES